MKIVTLSGHVEGQSIRLDEPFDLPPNARLLITILPDEDLDMERFDWIGRAKQSLNRAYATDEPD
jgi:hypothetical protein